ncbi:MAG: FAD-binding oxidoreductase [Thermoplasmataceae archaeon]
MPPKKYDVIIVGAGIVGLTSAYYIKKMNKDLSVAVLERAPTFGQGNSGRSAAGFRDLFSSQINFQLSHSTIEYYKHVQNDIGINIGVDFVGYLFLLASGDGRTELLRKIGGKTRIREFQRDELKSLGFLNLSPNSEESAMMSLKSIDVGILGENCGTIEPELITEYYYKESVDLGVDFFFNCQVDKYNLSPVKPLDYPGEPFLWQEKKIGVLNTTRGEMEADTYISATDVWTTSLLDPTGIDSHIRPKKRQVFQASGPKAEEVLFGWPHNERKVLPFTILPSHGVFMRPAPKAKSLWVGVADDYGRDFSFTDDPQPEESFYTLHIAPVLNAYVPGIAESRITASWAGHYSYNTIDKTPYIFKDLNIIVATGTSGSGILKGDSIGRYVEAVYSGREKVRLYDGTEIDSSDLGVKHRKVEFESVVL